MSYLVLARKWRPQGFDDLIGQEPISRILQNAISQGRIAHAYLFSGPRGIGKTSTARILAKALNCEKGPTPSPCGVCISCRGIADGSSLDVMEIDGASNNSVNDIRDLRERVRYAPSEGRYKIYIIDEAHMLSDAAFNALLKTLEEPPPHVVFVLATTAARKIPATVLSRCQHLPFRRIPLQRIRERLRAISDSEGINISDRAIEMIARASEGSMRDSLTILDQVSAFTSDIDGSEIKDLLGIADFKALSELSMAIINGDRKRILELIAELADRGTDFKSFSKDLLNFFRDLLVAKVVGRAEGLLDISDSETGVIAEIIRSTSDDYLTVLLSEMIKAEAELRLASSSRVALEMSLLRASFLSTLRPVKEAIEGLESLMAGHAERGSDIPPASPSEKGDNGVSDRIPEGVSPEQQKETLQDYAPRNDRQEADSNTGAIEYYTEEPSPAEGDIRKLLIKRIETVNHPLSCRLSGAEIRMDGDSIIIAFNGGTAIHADSVKKNIRTIEDAASELMGRKVSVRVDITKKKATRKRENREKILSEPLIKEAIELFEGRVIDIIPSENSDNGGRDVQKDVR